MPAVPPPRRTAAELAAWGTGLVAYFDGYARPTATGLYAARVEDVTTDMHAGEAGAVALSAALIFR